MSRDIWDAPVRLPRRALSVLCGSLFVVAVAVFAAVMAVSARDDGRTQVLIATMDAESLAAASAAASAVLFFLLVCAIPAPRWWLLLFVPLRLAAFGAMLVVGLIGVVTGGGTVVPLVAQGCETGYVVSERPFLRSARIEVLRPEGILATSVANVSTDDGHTPFSQGSYMVVVDGDLLRVWHTFDSATEPLGAVGEPRFVLPRIVDPGDVRCGLAGGPEPVTSLPSPTVAPDPDGGPRPTAAGDPRVEVVRLAALVVNSAIGPVTDAAGAPVAIPSAAELPCDGATGIDLALSTGDNARSYSAILAAFDAAGFATDRAMQEDLRYDGVVRVSARDRSTIDGMLHFVLGAECRTS
ncbi:hypothetical protein [Microbacterium sp. Leaf179]|uniref:hypothetical protein n=1 Tax=Microbacterium sp. Leaf179 TaxID=1736288 RepID=UPI0012E3CC2D|nr:hypothetical protein [Microbacterium sp. Leaf179]